MALDLFESVPHRPLLSPVLQSSLQLVDRHSSLYLYSTSVAFGNNNLKNIAIEIPTNFFSTSFTTREMRLIKNKVELNGSGTVTLCPEEPEDMVRRPPIYSQFALRFSRC